MTYEIAAIFCGWLLLSDGSEEKICGYYKPEEPQLMSLSECRDERVNLRIISARQGLVSIVTCAFPEGEKAPPSTTQIMSE